MMPKVSVLIPVFNAERFVAESVGSILRQTFRDFELIAIDDGSIDDSNKILTECARTDSRIRVKSRPNLGIVATLNEALGLARGKYVARMDADDVCVQERLAVQVAVMDANDELVALGSNSIVTDPDGRRLGTFAVPLSHEELDSAHLEGRSSIHHPSVIMRTDALRTVGGYREGFCPAEDLDLWIRLAEVGRIANVPEPLLIRRLTLDGIVATRSHEQEDTVRRILTDAWRRRGLTGQPNFPRIKQTSLAGRYRLWSHVALEDRQPTLANEYAKRALANEPYNPRSWLALFRSVFAAKGFPHRALSGSAS